MLAELDQQIQGSRDPARVCARARAARPMSVIRKFLGRNGQSEIRLVHGTVGRRTLIFTVPRVRGKMCNPLNLGLGDETREARRRAVPALKPTGQCGYIIEMQSESTNQLFSVFPRGYELLG